MKPILLMLLIFSAAIGCTKNDDKTTLSSQQTQAVQQMNSSYQNAKLYNDSMTYALNTMRNATSIMIHIDGRAMADYFDSRYHYYVSQFDSCHKLYQHNPVSADHFHNSVGEVEMYGNVMRGCQCCSNGGHSAEIHQKMSELRQLHGSCHAN